ncbi:transglycosylase family protein [Streptomyces sp. NPDC091292]|uniref:transglycosylase family protein n=1 Tax=Streptomyces sp. NPDC091292 TaxID=3365991 RepID=UPI0038024E9E
MLSGNGRHRRPRQVPALVVAAGVTGSALAIPLLGATGASAADGAAWDRLAECESGGSWSADPGNGYFGGLQFSQETWEDFGGLAYAPRADQASRSQQIAVAERVLAVQGPDAWVSCAPIAGLTKGGASADVDTGTAPSGTPSKVPGKSSGSSGSSQTNNSSDATKKPVPSTSPDSSPTTDPSSPAGDATSSEGKNQDSTGKTDKSADSTTDLAKSDENEASSGSGSSGDSSATGRHRGDSADEGAGDAADSRTDDSAGRHASRGDGERGAADGTYTVRPGDSLWGIADSHDLKGGWTALYDGNKATVGADPDLILPGQSLDLLPESDITQQ